MLFLRITPSLTYITARVSHSLPPSNFIVIVKLRKQLQYMRYIIDYIKTKGKYKINWYKPEGERSQWFEILLTMANVDNELFR